MDNYIILNNITQSEITIDMITVPIQDGFKGIYYIPQGVHYVSITVEDGKEVGFWCFFEGEEGVITKSFNTSKQIFEEWTDEEAKKAVKLTLAKEFNDFMVVCPKGAIDIWFSLVQCINEIGSIPELRGSKSVNQSFNELFNETYKGDIASVIAEFQYAFVRMAIESPEKNNKEAAERWEKMMGVFYSATQEEIEENQQFFIEWIDFLFHQFEILPDISFQRTGEAVTYKIIVKNAASLCDKLMKCSDEETVISGNRLRLYLTQRGAQL